MGPSEEVAAYWQQQRLSGKSEEEAWRGCPRGDYLAFVMGSVPADRQLFVPYVAAVAHLIRRAAQDRPLPPLASQALDRIDAWVLGNGDANACGQAGAALLPLGSDPQIDALVFLLNEPKRCEEKDGGSGSGWWRSATPVRSVALAVSQRTDPQASCPLPAALAWAADVLREVVPSPPGRIKSRS